MMLYSEIRRVSEIRDIIEKYFYEPDVFFVFSNSVSLNTWSDYAVRKDSNNGNGRVFESDRFITWKQFRRDYLVSHNSDAKVISDTVRKLFVISLLAENVQKPFLKSVINEEYKEYWKPSVDLVCQILPGLREWKEKFKEAQNEGNYVSDDEDKDFNELYNRYDSFLRQHNLYEKAWCNIELKPRSENQKFIIILPEQINDFNIRYKEKLAAYSNIEIISFSKSDNPVNVEYYKDVRAEIRMTALKIRKLLEESEAVNSIAVLVPEENFETLRPYISRELENHGIPCTVSSSKSVSSTSSASLLKQIELCVSNNYYFDNFSAVLLNPYVRWKEKDTVRKIISVGRTNCCLLNTDDKDFWKECLTDESPEKILYQRLSSSMNRIYRAGSFSELNREVTYFLNNFLEVDDCAPLKACLLKLLELEISEKEYKSEIGTENHLAVYNDFISALSVPVFSVPGGISVIKYTDGIDADFKYKFVVSADQSSIGLTYTPLDFIKNETKRRNLKLYCNDEYAQKLLDICSASENVEFSCSENTFSDFGVPFIGFDTVIEKDSLKEITKKLETYEFNELNNLEDQHKAFDFYLNHRVSEKEEGLSENTKKSIDEFIKNQKKLDSGHSSKPDFVLISQTDLADFFPCPRKWVMKRYFSVKEQENDVSLLNKFDAGTIKHRIIELFFEKTIEPGNELFSSDYMDSHRKEMLSVLEGYAETAINSLTTNNKDKNKGLSRDCLVSQKSSFAIEIFDFLKFLFDDIKKDDSTNCNWCFGVSEAYRDKDYDDDDNKYKVFGRLDLLLYKKTDPKRYAIIDFKNKSLESHTPKTNTVNEDKIKDFQCSVYVLIQEGKFLKNDIEEPKPELEKMGFYSITGQDKKNIITTKKSSSRSNSVSTKEYKSTLSQLVKYCERFALDKEKSPNGKDRNDLNYVDVNEDCRKCKFKSMCRTTFTIGGRTL